MLLNETLEVWSMVIFSTRGTGLFWGILSVLALSSCAFSDSAPLAQSPASTPSQTSPTPLETAPASAEIWPRLRQGTGYVVLLRHAQTVAGTGDPPGFRLNDCATQRNLSEVGREQAMRIGQTFKEQNISVVQVLSSQYCRCLDTAKLMNVGTVEPAPMLNSIFEDRSTADLQKQEVNQQILNHRGKTGVIVMVTHYANISAISGVAPQSGDAVVLQADQQGEIELVGQLQGI
jgi:phosphohistidine phosphatase SixA